MSTKGYVLAFTFSLSKIDRRKFNKMIDSFDCRREMDVAESRRLYEYLVQPCFAVEDPS